MVFIWEKLDKNEFRLVDLVEPEIRPYSLSHLHNKLRGFHFRQKMLKADYMQEWLDKRGVIPSSKPQNRNYGVITYDELLYFRDLVKDFTSKTHYNEYIPYKYKRVDDINEMIAKAEKIMEAEDVEK